MIFEGVDVVAFGKASEKLSDSEVLDCLAAAKNGEHNPEADKITAELSKLWDKE